MEHLKSLIFVLALVFTGNSIALYNQALGKQLYFLAISAMCTPDMVRAWDCPTCSLGLTLTNVDVIADKANVNLIYVGVSAELSAVVVAMRGDLTAEKTNGTSFMGQSRVNFAGCSGCKVNSYFWNSYFPLEQQILASIRSKMTTVINSVTVVGFSVGGGMVPLLVGKLTQQNIPMQHVYTFGAPRTGNYEFASWVRDSLATTVSDGKHYRVTHGRDAMPAINTIAVYYYQHISQEVYYASAFNIGFKACNDFKSEDTSCSQQFYKHNWEDHWTYYDLPLNQLVGRCMKA